MQLGDVIARFEDAAVVHETLFELDDLALIARVAAAAEEQDVSMGEFAAQAIGQFVSGASAEAWLTVVGLISHANSPGDIFLRHVLSKALPLSRQNGCR